MDNKVVHFEVIGKDGTGLQKFYGGLFDWTFDTDNPMNYGLVPATEDAIGGGVGAAPEGSPGHLTFYVEVADVAAALEKAVSLGGSIVMPETSIMEQTTIGLFADPEGHVMGLVEAAE